MIKVRISYQDETEKDKLIKGLKDEFKVLHESKSCNGKGPYKKTYIDLQNN